MRPVTVPAVIVAGAVPVEVTVIVFVASEPTSTCPKLSVLALAESDGVLATTPLPCIFTASVGLLAESLDTVIVPFASPSLLGLNFSFSDIC